MALSASASRKGEFRDHQHGGKAAGDRAPSNLILTGRYILQPEILDILPTYNPAYLGGEIST